MPWGEENGDSARVCGVRALIIKAARRPRGVVVIVVVVSFHDGSRAKQKGDYIERRPQSALRRSGRIRGARVALLMTLDIYHCASFRTVCGPLRRGSAPKVGTQPVAKCSWKARVIVQRERERERAGGGGRRTSRAIYWVLYTYVHIGSLQYTLPYATATAVRTLICILIREGKLGLRWHLD